MYIYTHVIYIYIYIYIYICSLCTLIKDFIIHLEVIYFVDQKLLTDYGERVESKCRFCAEQLAILYHFFLKLISLVYTLVDTHLCNP